MRPDGKKVVKVGCRTYHSMLPYSHQPCYLAPGFHTQFLEAVLPISLKYAALDAFRYRHQFLFHASDIGATVRLWIAAATALPYTNDVGQRVVDTVLRMADHGWLQPHIPVSAWDWLKKRPALGAGCRGFNQGTYDTIVQMARELGDIGLITSYLFLVWSEWSWIFDSGFQAMLRSVREELSGIGAAGYRADLIQRLDDVLPRLEPGSTRKQQYEEFRMALLEVDEEAMGTLTGMSHRVVILFSLLTCVCVHVQDATLPSCARFLFCACSRVHGLSEYSFLQCVPSCVNPFEPRFHPQALFPCMMVIRNPSAASSLPCTDWTLLESGPCLGPKAHETQTSDLPVAC